MTSRGKLTVSGFLESNKDKCISGVNSVLVLILDPNWGSELFFSLTAHLTGMRNRKQKKKKPHKKQQDKQQVKEHRLSILIKQAYTCTNGWFKVTERTNYCPAELKFIKLGHIVCRLF